MHYSHSTTLLSPHSTVLTLQPCSHLQLSPYYSNALTILHCSHPTTLLSPYNLALTLQPCSHPKHYSHPTALKLQHCSHPTALFSL